MIVIDSPAVFTLDKTIVTAISEPCFLTFILIIGNMGGYNYRTGHSVHFRVIEKFFR